MYGSVPGAARNGRPYRDRTNPAWDFQRVIPNPEAKRTYPLDLRVLYNPWAGRADVPRKARNYLS